MKKKEKIYIAKSTIHGQGAFAAVDIKKDEKIIEYIGEKITKEESEKRGLELYEKAQKDGSASVYIFELDDEYDLDGNIEGNIAKYINHACQTNCEAIDEDGRIWICATCDIKKDSELFFNYGYALEHFLDNPCRCGFEGCVGYIVSEDDRPKLQKILKNKRKKKILKPLTKG